MTEPALVLLVDAVATLHGSHAKKLLLAQLLRAAAKAVSLDRRAVDAALGAYESAVAARAHGDGAFINKSGLLSRDVSSPAAMLDKVTVLHAKQGKHAAEAIVSWPAAPGATSYAIEVNFTPQDPGSTWTALSSAAGRRRVVKGPTPGCQLLVRVASVASDGTLSEWSDVSLATTRP